MKWSTVLDARGTYTTYPIRNILNVNWTWVRKNVAGTEEQRNELADSLNRDGMLLPVLLRKDLVVVDGARRLLVAREDLGWNQVPVLITDDWARATQHYADAVKLAAEGYPHVPMDWFELAELCTEILPKVYDKRREELTDQFYQNKIQGTPTRKIPHYTRGLAELLGIPFSQLNLIREMVSVVLRLESASPEMGKVARLLVNETYTAEGRLYSLFEHIKDMRDGLLTLEQAAKFEILPKGRKGNRTISPRTRSVTRAKPKDLAPTEGGQLAPKALVQAIALRLDNFAMSIREMSGIEQGMSPSEAGDAAKLIGRAQRQLTKLRGLLERHADPAPSQEREEQ